MATKFYGSTISSAWRGYGSYSTSSTGTSYTITLAGGMQSTAWGIQVSYVDCTVYIGDSSTSTTNNSFYSATGATVTTQMASLSKTISKTTSSQTVTLKVVTYNHSGYKNGTSTATTTITIPALASYTVSYNANGGSGAPSSQTKYYGKTLTLSTTKPTRTNYTFLGWSTSSSATSATYSSGGSYTTNAAATLYAVWSLNHSAPTLSSIKAYRSTSSGTASDTGTYIYVGFAWEIDGDDYSVDSIAITIASSGAGTTTTKTVSASGTSGTVSNLYSTFSTEYSYTVTITVTDTASLSTKVIRNIGSTSYVMDFLKGGTGVAIGKTSTEEELFDCAWPANFDESITMSSVQIPVVQFGRVNIVPEANTPTSTTIAFDVEYSSTPRVCVTPVTTVPGTTVLGVGTNSISTTGFTLYLTRTNATTTAVDWIAVGYI